MSTTLCLDDEGVRIFSLGRRLEIARSLLIPLGFYKPSCEECRLPRLRYFRGILRSHNRGCHRVHLKKSRTLEGALLYSGPIRTGMKWSIAGKTGIILYLANRLGLCWAVFQGPGSARIEARWYLTSYLSFFRFY